jgi:hypothetical protein
MKITRTILFNFFSLVFIFLINTSLFSQVAKEHLDGNAKLNEALLCSTDRDIYFTGEQVWMKMYKLNMITSAPCDISKIVYVELLDESDNPVVQLKVWVDGISGSCGFRLPDTLTSNSYLIRAYSRWMQNYSVDNFYYKTIYVINPFKDIGRLIPKPEGSLKNSGISVKPNGVSQTDSQAVISENRLNINIKLNKNKFSTRDFMKLEISATDPSGNPVKADFSVSVTKSCLEKTPGKDFFFENKREGILNSGSSSGILIPEPEGEIISGVIKNKTTNKPLSDTDISLSFVGKDARCLFGRTNEKGEFIFVADVIYGLNEMVIQPLVHDNDGSYVELDQPFCNTFSDYNPTPFYIDSSKIEYINKAIISAQVHNQYEPLMPKSKELADSKAINNFYSIPTRRILMSDFIELSDVREIIKELLPEVLVEKKDKEPLLRVQSNNPFESFKEPSLVLVDGVPVYDIENLLKTKAVEIEKIDVVDTRYFYHNFVFEGIINFITRKGNLSIFEFDNSVFRSVYEGCQPRGSFYSPDYSDESAKKNRIPDFRNTLYWNPDVSSDVKGNASTEFFTSDEKGEYTIIVEGMNFEGVCGSASVIMQVE